MRRQFPNLTFVEACLLQGRAHFELGRLYDAGGRHREAADAFAAAAAVPPVLGEERVYELIGRALIADTDFEGAIQAFTRRVEVSPNYAPAHRALAETYLQLGRDDEALAELTAAALIEPADALAHAGRAQLYLRSGRYQEAAGAARAALARDGSNLTALYALMFSDHLDAAGSAADEILAACCARPRPPIWNGASSPRRSSVCRPW